MYNNALCNVTQQKTTGHTKAHEDRMNGVEISPEHALLWNAKYFSAVSTTASNLTMAYSNVKLVHKMSLFCLQESALL